MTDVSRGGDVSKGRGHGFASMEPEQKRAIASKGGKVAHERGTAHNWRNDPEGARSAGRIGGSRRKPKRIA